MDSIIEDRDTLFSQLFAHFKQIESHPSTVSLDEELLKRTERSLDASTPQTLLWRLLSTGEHLLQNVQQDPRPLTRLLERNVLLIPFDDLKVSISAEKLQEGLKSPSVPVQLLCLAYLRKASDSPSGAAFVAASSDLTQCLVTIWLSSENTEVAERALEDLIALLAVDSPESLTVVNTNNKVGEAQGQGLMLRRVFHDSDVYSLLFGWTSLTKSRHELNTKKGAQQVTISQGRLFDFIARISEIDWTAITTSTLPDVESLYMPEGRTSQPYGGLLRYAASNMIDSKDYLMEILRQDFFMKLLATIEYGNNQNVSPRLLQAIQENAGVRNDSQNQSTGVYL